MYVRDRLLPNRLAEMLSELESIWISTLRTCERTGLDRDDRGALRTGIT